MPPTVGQQNKDRNLVYLEACCKKVAEIFTEKPVAAWQNADYVSLSRAIAKKTRVYLSENTLKRVYGKIKSPHGYFPQKASRDAMAQYIGFANWNELENNVDAEINAMDITRPDSDPNVMVAISPVKKLLVRIAALLALLALTYGAFTTYSYLSPPAPSGTLTCHNDIGINQHSAVFSLNIDKTPRNTRPGISIDFGDGTSKGIDPGDSIINHYYKAPGLYRPVLFVDNTPVDTSLVYVKTQGWQAIASMPQDTERVYPVIGHSFLPDYFHVSGKELSKSGIDTTKTFYVTFSNIKRTSITTDNMQFKAFVKSSPERTGVRCSQVDITLFGENGRHEFSMMKPGCTYWTHYRFSEITKSGTQSDAREMGYDFSDGAPLLLTIRAGRVVLNVDQQDIIKLTYNKRLGNLMGVSVTFSGVGSFSNLQITDLSSGEQF